MAGVWNPTVRMHVDDYPISSCYFPPSFQPAAVSLDLFPVSSILCSFVSSEALISICHLNRSLPIAEVRALMGVLWWHTSHLLSDGHWSSYWLLLGYRCLRINPFKYSGIWTIISKVSHKGTTRNSMIHFPNVQKYSNYTIYSNRTEETEKKQEVGY